MYVVKLDSPPLLVRPMLLTESLTGVTRDALSAGMHVGPSVWPCPSQLLLITQAASNRRWRRAVTAERLRAAIPKDLLLADDDAVLRLLFSARGWEPLQVSDHTRTPEDDLVRFAGSASPSPAVGLTCEGCVSGHSFVRRGPFRNLARAARTSKHVLD